MLAYSERFYQRQFIKRRLVSYHIYDWLNALPDAHFTSDALVI
ncbi:hypothetical protein [Spirosoma oryzicola]|nr:hypothetical protein [Spirosoma oryzicola]